METIIKIDMKSATFVTTGSNRKVSQFRLVKNIEANGINVPPIVFRIDDFSESNIKFYDLLTREEIPQEKKNDCYIVADGQHRIAAALFLAKNPRERDFTEIKAVLYDKEELHGMSLPEFIANINSTGEKWKHSDFIHMAAKELNEDLTVQIINSMKDAGMSISTISRYLAFKNRAINDFSLIKYMNEDKTALKDVNCGRGLKILNLLLQKHFTLSFLKKRYLIDYIISEFNHRRFRQCLDMLAMLSQQQVRHIQDIPHDDLEKAMCAKLNKICSGDDELDDGNDTYEDDILMDDSDDEEIEIPTDDVVEGLKLFKSLIQNDKSISRSIRKKFKKEGKDDEKRLWSKPLFPMQIKTNTLPTEENEGESQQKSEFSKDEPSTLHEEQMSGDVSDAESHDTVDIPSSYNISPSVQKDDSDTKK